MFPSASPRLVFLLALLAVYLPSILAQHAYQALGKRDAFSDSGLSLASWIWLPEPDLLTTAPPGNVAFIKTLTSPPGKTAASAQIAIAVDNNFTLWCNAQPIGASDGIVADGWKTAQLYSVALNASANTFSVLGTNAADDPGGATPAGLLAAIRIFYTDGTNDTVLSNSTWLVSGTVPADFPVPLDPSSLVPAEVATKYGSGPWGTSVTLATPAANPLNLTGSTWIWSTSNATVDAPVGTVGFRKTIASPSGKTASSATVLLTADNTFQLYINSQFIGSPPFDNNAPGSTGSWEYAQRFTVALTPSSNVITVLATNFPPQQTGGTSGAGLIAAVQIKYTDESSDIILTDTSWLTGPVSSASSASASAFLALADSTLKSSISQGPFGIAPWGHLLGVSDALTVLKLPANNAAVQSNPSSTKTTTPTTTTPTTLSPSQALQTSTTVPTTTSSAPDNSTPSTTPGTGGTRGRVTPATMLVFALSVMTFLVL